MAGLQSIHSRLEPRAMSTYPQRVRENILPLSVAQSLPDAFLEWRFTERTIDHEEAIETCELCEQEQLRYHFEIGNQENGNLLLIGSQCILRFNVAVYDNGIRLSDAGVKRKLNKLIKQMHMQACIAQLQRLAEAENNEILRNALSFYSGHGYLTPKFAFVVLWRLQENKIDHNPSFFKVSLIKDRYKRDLKEMQLSRVHAIWPALTSSQRKLAMAYGHTAPPST